MAGTRGRLGSSAPQSKQITENVETQEGAVGEVGNSDERAEGSGEGSGWKTVGKSKARKYLCKGGEKNCGLALTDNEDSIMCDMCKLWFHPKCQGLSIDAFRAHAKYDFIWLCIECKPRFAEVVDVSKHVVARIDEAEKNILSALKANAHDEGQGGKIESKISDMEKMVVEQIKEQQNRTEVALKEQNDVVREMPKYSEVLKKSVHELKEIVKTKEDKEHREKNILIHNIPECQSADPEVRKNYDHATFYNIVSALYEDSEATDMEVVSVVRLGKKQEPAEKAKPRLMMVKLKNKEGVNKLIKRRTQLRNVGFSNTYLTRDLSAEERQEQKKLREELNRKGKEAYKIFRGRIVPRERMVHE